MKKTIFIPLAVVFAFAACNKTEIPAINPATSTNTVVHSTSRTLTVDFSYTLTKDQYGDYSCPTPKTDCSKITPDLYFSFNDIDHEIGQGPAAISYLFNNDGWEDYFPFLADEVAEEYLTGIQDEDYTLVRTTNTHGDVFYFVVPYAKYDTWTQGDIVFTFMFIP